MNHLLLLSTPLADSHPGIALIDTPQSIQRVKEEERKVQTILGYENQFWKSVGGVVWNPETRSGTYNGRKGFMVSVPKLANREFSFLNASNFPNEWNLEQRETFVSDQIERILFYTSVNSLWLPAEQKWEQYWNRNGY